MIVQGCRAASLGSQLLLRDKQRSRNRIWTFARFGSFVQPDASSLGDASKPRNPEKDVSANIRIWAIFNSVK
jgi:hypothetical protein